MNLDLYQKPYVKIGNKTVNLNNNKGCITHVITKFSQKYKVCKFHSKNRLVIVNPD